MFVLIKSLLGVYVVDLCSMEKLLCTWLQRMGAMMLHGCFLLMVLLLKPKQMCFPLSPPDYLTVIEFKFSLGMSVWLF